MNSTGLQRFSDELKKQRTDKDISLQQISSKTKIDMKFLKAIEENNFGIMPEVYMRAFIKEYANTIGLDGAGTLIKFDKYKSGEFSAIEEEVEYPERHGSDSADKNVKEFDSATAPGRNKDEGDGISKNQIIYILGGAIVIIVVLVIYFGFLQDGKSEIVTERQVLPPVVESTEKPVDRFVEKTPEKISNPTENATQKSFTVKVTATDTSWMRVLIDDKITDEFMLNPNSAKDLTAEDNMKFLLGNSGGVQFWLNGENLNFQGVKGVIKNVRIDKNGLSLIQAPGKN